MTHQLQYLKGAKHVVLLNTGKIETQGTYDDLNLTHYNSIRRMSSTVEAENKNNKEDEIQVRNFFFQIHIIID